eukprot:scaffold309932_cov17-Tisochrysis_lutea.AAC.1
MCPSNSYKAGLLKQAAGSDFVEAVWRRPTQGYWQRLAEGVKASRRLAPLCCVFPPQVTRA